MLRPVYDRLKGGDGYVSLEVSPYLAMDTAGTVAEARRLWKDVNRKNLMVKVPATPEGLPAIETLIGDGISINITLLFSKAVYLRGRRGLSRRPRKICRRAAATPRMSRAWRASSSAASTRVVDKQLDEKIARANDPSEKERLAALKGKVAIANAKVAYQDYKRLFSGPRWEKLAAKGAKPQRMLWASTGTKNKDYSDVLYVEELIGPDTVNTVPPATLDAFRDHGKPRDSLEENVDDAQPRAGRAGALRRLARRHHRGARQGRRQAVRRCRRQALRRGRPQARDRARARESTASSLSLGDGLGKAVAKSTEEWRASAKIRRLWQRDKSVWTGTDEDKWLGWLDSAAKADVADYEDYANRVKGQKFSDAVVLGMGGSSLGPEVLAETFARKAGFPKLHVLDSTDPAQVRAMEAKIDIANTVFIVSSKSGGTTEPNAMKDYFHERVAQALGPKAKTGYPLHRGDRSRLLAGEGGEEAQLCPHLPWRAVDRRPLFGAVAVRPGAGGHGRHRRQDLHQARALDGALLRAGRAAG